MSKVHPFPFFLRDYYIVKGCLLDSFNTVFNHACPSFHFVPNGLKESIGYHWTQLILSLIILVHTFPLFLRS